MDNEIIFIIIVCILVFYYMFYYKNENMTNMTNPSDQTSIMENVYLYIQNNPDDTFSDYINFLQSIGNINLNLIDNEVFVTFKLLKKRNMFTITDVQSAMKL